MRTAFFILLLAFGLSACSLYKSQIRKDFENDAPSHLAAQGIAITSCEPKTALAAWAQRDFPEGRAEILAANDDDTEVWKIVTDSGHVLLRAFRGSEAGVEVCTREFADENAWRAEGAAELAKFTSPE